MANIDVQGTSSSHVNSLQEEPGAAAESAAIQTVSSTVSLLEPQESLGSSVTSDSTSPARPSSSSRRRLTSFFDDGAKNILPPSEWGFPVPKKGQSLTDFLMFSDFNTNMSPLDKENAHFYIAEALIQAIECFNFHCEHNGGARRREVTSESEVEREPTKLQQKHRRKLRERKSFSLVASPTTDYSSSMSRASSERNFNDADEQDSSSQTSLDSDDSQALTAEGVALCLLRNFKDKPLPKASDLIWMIHDGDTEQELLPLPNSWPVSPDDTVQVHRRGTEDWAPPRRHIIHNVIFREGNIKTALSKQNFRCAGCGTKVEPNSKLRMCHYLGKYFCQICHQNAKSLIPARISLKWDFTFYPVSNFARDLLQSLESDPVFDLCDHNRGTFTTSRQLEKVSQIRRALIMAAQYVLNCKNANKGRILRTAEHHYRDQYKYSLEDFIKTRNGVLHRELLDIYDRCVRHVITCQLCNAQGYICEKCNESDPIFPFDVNNVLQCGACRACFHRSCVRGAFICGKCKRREKRNCETIQEAEEAQES